MKRITREITPTPLDIERFWERVDRRGPDECWPWTGPLRSVGLKYGAFHPGAADGSTSRWLVGAHRFAYAAAHGHLPSGKLVCHKCDNPPCCNPKHLFLGTDTDNIRDMWRKGRAANNARGFSGAENGMAKLTESDVLFIRGTKKGKHLNLAKRFGVTHATIRFARTGYTWKHLGGVPSAS